MARCVGGMDSIMRCVMGSDSLQAAVCDLLILWCIKALGFHGVMVNVFLKAFNLDI